MKTKKAVNKFAREFLLNKRGVTPVLSSLLLTVIAVAAMAAATSATYVITTNLKETMSERVLSEDVWFNPSTHTIDVYLCNVGKVNIHISNVYVNHTRQSFNNPFNLGIEEGDWVSISCNWNSGSLYDIDIVTNRGTHIASVNEAP